MLHLKKARMTSWEIEERWLKGILWHYVGYPCLEPAAWLWATFAPKYPLIFPANLINQERIRLIKSIRLCHDCINHVPLVTAPRRTWVRVCPSQEKKPWVHPSEATIDTRVCVCGQKGTNEHLQATIMGNFPTAAELKLLKTKRENVLPGVVDEMERQRDR